MGADIFLRSVNQKALDEHKPKFHAAVEARDAYAESLKGKALTPEQEAEAKRLQDVVIEHYNGMFSEGYYRDSYNATSLFGVIGFSYWKDMTPDLVDSRLPVPKMLVWRQRIAEAMIDRDAVRKVVSQSKDSFDDWLAYFEAKRERFIALLDQAIELNEPLDCSL